MSTPSTELTTQDPPIGVNDAYIFPNSRNFSFKANPMSSASNRPITGGQEQTLFYFDTAVLKDKKVLCDVSGTPILNVKMKRFARSWIVRSGRSSTSGTYLGKVSSHFFSSKLLAEFTNTSDGRLITLSIKKRELGQVLEVSLEPEGHVIARAIRMSEGIFSVPRFLLTVPAGVDASLIITLLGAFQLVQARRREAAAASSGGGGGGS